MIGYFATLVIGIVLGKLFFDKELRLKLHNKLHGKRTSFKRYASTNTDNESTKVCSMCNGDEFVLDIELNKQIKCPRCKGTGIDPNL
jgi:DnaJ-class molecular chaperone